MDSGALCVMMSLEHQKRGLLVINLGLPEDTLTTQMLVPGTKCINIGCLNSNIPLFISMHACSTDYRSILGKHAPILMHVLHFKGSMYSNYNVYNLYPGKCPCGPKLRSSLCLSTYWCLPGTLLCPIIIIATNLFLSISTTTTRFTAASSTTPTWLDRLSCSSCDTRLTDCAPTGTIGVKNCDHSKDIVLFCLGSK